jgi:DNA-binding MarR family transcriptional regulator
LSRLNDQDTRALGVLLRIPALAVNRAVLSHIVERYPDFRAVYQPVFQYIDHPPHGPAGTRLTALAERAGLSKQALIEVIDEMERRGYVARIADPNDRRAKLICLTPRGMEVHEHAAGAIAAIDADWAARIGEESLDRLKELLERLNDALEQDVHGGSAAAGPERA